MSDWTQARPEVIAIGVVLALGVAIIGGLLTESGPWHDSLRMPAWRPPTWMFGPAWTVIFAFIAASGIVAWLRADGDATRALLVALLAVNGALNIAWSGIFFRLRRPDWAFLELLLLWLSILALVVLTARISTTAGWLMSPYLAWVTFAGALNLRIVQLNGPFKARA